MSRSVRVILFDAADTLFEVKGLVGETYASAARKYGREVSAERMQERFAAAFSAAPPPAFPRVTIEKRKILEKEWWERVVRRAFDGIEPEPFAPFFDEIFRYFSSAEAWRLFPETKLVLERLATGLRLGIISNFDSRLYGILQGFGIRRYFEKIVLSSEAGSAKPAPAIFQAAIDLFGIDPEEGLYIGDHEGDVSGAVTAGLRAAVIRRGGAIGGGADGEPGVPTLKSLNEIEGLILPK